MENNLSQEQFEKLSPAEQEAYMKTNTGEGKGTVDQTPIVGSEADPSNVTSHTTMYDGTGPIDGKDNSIRPESAVPKGYVHAAQYENKLRELSLQVSDLSKQLSAQRAKNEGLDINQKVVKRTVPSKLVSHEGKSYKFMVPSFNLPGVGLVHAEEAALDSATVAKIVAIEGQGVLVEQV